MHKYPVWETWKAAGVKLSVYRGIHTFSKTVGATSNFFAQEGWRNGNSTLRIHK